MAFHKKHLFHPTLQEVAALCDALSHPARLLILDHLADRNGMYVHDLVTYLPYVQATVSEHLEKLRRVKLVNVETQGLFHRYSINFETISRAKKLIHQSLSLVNSQDYGTLDRLSDYYSVRSSL